MKARRWPTGLANLITGPKHQEGVTPGIKFESPTHRASPPPRRSPLPSSSGPSPDRDAPVRVALHGPAGPLGAAEPVLPDLAGRGPHLRPGPRPPGNTGRAGPPCLLPKCCPSKVIQLSRISPHRIPPSAFPHPPARDIVTPFHLRTPPPLSLWGPPPPQPRQEAAGGRAAAQRRDHRPRGGPPSSPPLAAAAPVAVAASSVARVARPATDPVRHLIRFPSGFPRGSAGSDP